MNPVTITAEEYVELEQGVKLLPGTTANAARLMSALEYTSPEKPVLEAQRKELLGKMNGKEEAGPRMFRIPLDCHYASRVAIRLRHTRLKRLEADRIKNAVAVDDDLAQLIITCQLLGKKLGLQLELISQAETSTPGSEQPDLLDDDE